MSFLGISIYKYFYVRSVKSSGIRVKGTVKKIVETDSRTDDFNSSRYSPIIEFEDLSGIVHEINYYIRTSNKNKYSIGQNLTVIYHKDDPNKFIIDNSSGVFLIVLFVFIGLLLISISIIGIDVINEKFIG